MVGVLYAKFVKHKWGSVVNMTGTLLARLAREFESDREVVAKASLVRQARATFENTPELIRDDNNGADALRELFAIIERLAAFLPPKAWWEFWR